MAVDLSTKLGNGGSSAALPGGDPDGLINYPSKPPLKLEPRGLLLPHQGDSSKVGYVVEGRAIVGVILPGAAAERILRLRKGDVVAVPKGTFTWWYNNDDSDFSIVYLGDASAAVQPGQISFFFVAGTSAMFKGFSSEFLSSACGVSEEEAKELFRSQTSTQEIKLEQKITSVNPSEDDREGIVLNVENARLINCVEKGGYAISMTSENLAALEGFGFSVNITNLEPNAMRLPGFFPAVQLLYVSKGSGKVQITGINGANVLNEEMTTGSVFVVKKFYVMSVIAGSEGMELFSIIKKEWPVFHPVLGKTSPLNLSPPEVLKASLNVTTDLVELLRANGISRDVIIPPSG